MDTDSIWKFMRFNTIREYCDRTPLPAPFCLISHFYLLLQQCSSKCCKQRSNQINSLSKSDKVIQLKYDFEVISVFGILIFFQHASIPIVLVFMVSLFFFVKFSKSSTQLDLKKLMLLSLCIYYFRWNSMIIDTKIVVRKGIASELNIHSLSSQLA